MRGKIKILSYLGSANDLMMLGLLWAVGSNHISKTISNTFGVGHDLVPGHLESPVKNLFWLLNSNFPKEVNIPSWASHTFR